MATYLDRTFTAGNRRTLTFSAWIKRTDNANTYNHLITTSPNPGNWDSIRIENDGSFIAKGQSIAVLQGKIQTILSKERVVLNLLQRMSGITSQTKALVHITAPYSIQLLDTRKTTPQNRIIEKWAVRIGGGVNHRFVGIMGCFHYFLPFILKM